MRKNVIIGLIASALLVFSTTANAVEVSATFNLGSSNIANAVTGTATDIVLDLTPGDVIALDVTVSNLAGESLTAIFTSLSYDTTQLTFLGGAFNNILTEDGCVGFLCSPATMGSLPASPGSKINSPFSQGTGTADWIQAVAHTNIEGAAGTGPDVAVLLAFQYTGLGGFETILITSGETAGDATAVADGGVASPNTFSGATINVPEPGTALLMGLGLFGLGAAGRRRS